MTSSGLLGSPAHIEIAVPVADLVDGDDGVEAATLPAGEWLTFLRRGPYTHAGERDLVAAHATVRAWAGEHELALARDDAAGNEIGLSGCVEHYRLGPAEDSDYTRWQTEIAYLIDRDAT